MPDKLEPLPAFTPVPRAKDRSNGWKPEVQRAFIDALAETGSVRAACRRVGRADHGAYQLRRHPDAGGFRAAWDAALDLGVRRIEDGAMDRALYGTEETVHYHGEHVATRRRYNERLVMFILRNRAPERFAEGGAKALSALDHAALKKLKKQWEKEWEAQRGIKRVSVAEVRANIDRKIAALRSSVVASTSPASYALRLAECAQERADEAAGWRPGLPYADYAAAAAELLPQCLEQVRGEWPDYEGYHAEAMQGVQDEDDEPLALPPPKEEEDEPEVAERKPGEARVISLKDASTLSSPRT